MNLEKPLGEQMSNSLNMNPNAIGEGVSSMASSMGDSLNAAKQSMNNSLSEFSNANAVGATSSFLESNSMIAKFIFLILVVIGFVFIFRLAVIIMGYFIQTDPNPYIIKGMIDGNSLKTISTNPLAKNSIQILRSDNANSGLEFTWSVWLNIQDNKNGTTPKYNNVFVKGDGNFDTDGFSKVNNGPGMYITNKGFTTTTTVNGVSTVIPAEESQYASLFIVMDTVVNPGSKIASTGQIREIFDISNIPMQKWVHVAVRVQNKIMDLYVNGTVTSRKLFLHIPKQNYNDITVCGNGGFNGKLSNLRYFAHALNVLEISSILAQGPNTKPLTDVTAPKSMQYLSMNWYSNRM
jgi:hypothetical protein